MSNNPTENPGTEVVLTPNLDDPTTQALAFVKSGFFKDTVRQSQAITKILAGRELGVSPMSSMTGIYVIPSKGGGTKIQIGSNVLAALLRRHEVYDYRIVELTSDRCEIEFTRNGEALVPTVVFTMDDAKTAGLDGKDNWKHHPRNMLFARAISDGAKFHCPDLAMGMPLYTEGDEIEREEPSYPRGPVADFDNDDEVVDAEVVEEPPAAEPTAPDVPMATEGQLASIAGIIDTCGIDQAKVDMKLASLDAVEIHDLTGEGAETMISWLQQQVGEAVKS